MAVAAACAAGVAAVPVAGQVAGEPVSVRDGEDARGPLDLVAVELASTTGNDLRATLTMAEPWGEPALRVRRGAPGSICLRLWTRRPPELQAPDHLVCVAPTSDRRLSGRVLRDRANGLPRAVAAARLSRPDPRRIVLRFARSAVGRPVSLRFAAETVTRRSRCPRPLGCRDLAPEGRRAASFSPRPGG